MFQNIKKVDKNPFLQPQLTNHDINQDTRATFGVNWLTDFLAMQGNSETPSVPCKYDEP